MNPRPALLVFLCLVSLAGCAKTPPYQQAIEAETPLQFDMWRANLSGALPPEEWQWFDMAMQEFKFQLMLDQKVSGSEAITAAVRERINGRTLGDVMREGLHGHLQRKTAERDELEAAISINAKRKIRAGDTETIRDLAAHQENLRKKLAKLNDELVAVNAALGQLKAKAAPAP